MDLIQDRKTLCVFDPFNIKNNTTQKAFRINEIREIFSKAKDNINKEYVQIYHSEDFTQWNEQILDKIMSPDTSS